MMRTDLRHWAVQMRPGIGNFCIGDGHPPRSKTANFAYWSNFRSWLFRIWPEHIVFWYVIFTAGTLVSLRSSRNLFHRGASIIALGVAALGICEFAVATLADAVETNRHLFLFHVLTDITIYFAFAWLFSRFAERFPIENKDHVVIEAIAPRDHPA